MKKLMHHKKGRPTWLPVIILCLVAYYITHYIILIARVPSDSMMPTISEEDYIIGKRIYGDNVSRFDIMVFRVSEEKGKKLYVKRVIGLPNETVSIKDAHIYITNASGTTLLSEPYIKEVWIKDKDGYTFEIPDDCYLFLGDNRNSSYDARNWEEPFIKSSDLVAKVVHISSINRK